MWGAGQPPISRKGSGFVWFGNVVVHGMHNPELGIIFGCPLGIGDVVGGGLRPRVGSVRKNACSPQAISVLLVVWGWWPASFTLLS